ncbi:MAG: hypothetical protein P1V20_18570 [Verrucomicrobiales bacterium]|nr:hypothetical protein [Verrucomicrobiales bacterium]
MVGHYGGSSGMIQGSFKKNSCEGYCRRCRKVHSLRYGRSVEFARDMMAAFRREQRLDYDVPADRSDSALSFEILLPGSRGHMFGVMECLDRAGKTVILRAYSSLGTGVREVSGWVPYIPDNEVFNKMVLPQQNIIKQMTVKRNALDADDPLRSHLENERRMISRELMPKIHDLYEFRNFRGETRALREVFQKDGGIPGGVGDCCAPKLLNFAAVHDLKPVSVAEFYWGGANKSGRKQPGQFFPACEEKCQPILGFMLCGLEDGDE